MAGKRAHSSHNLSRGNDNKTLNLGFLAKLLFLLVSYKLLCVGGRNSIPESAEKSPFVLCVLLFYWSSSLHCACPRSDTQRVSWRNCPFGAGRGSAAKTNLVQRRWVGLCCGALHLSRCLIPPCHNTVTSSAGSPNSRIIVFTFLLLLTFVLLKRCPC